jgi:hypothetical protein
MALRMKPLPPLLGSNPAVTDSNLPNLPGQLIRSPTSGFPVSSARAIDATPFPGQKSFPAHLRTVPALSAPPPSEAAPADNAPKAVPSSKLPFFFCKISAKHLPRLDVFSASDPVCFVREVASNVVVHRTEVIPDDSDPDFQKQLRLKPQTDSLETNCASQAYMYDPQHVLSFAVYDSCRKDALASSGALSDSDLDPLGAVNVSVMELLRRIEMHEADPRTLLYLKFKLNRDATQSALSTTIEKLGNLQNKMNFFNPQSKKAPKLVLQLTLIRCDHTQRKCSFYVCSSCFEMTPIFCRSIGVKERFCWQNNDLWRVVDRGDVGDNDDAESENTTVSLLEMNPSHLPVIENALARAAAVSEEANGSEGLLVATTAAARPSIITLALSALGFKLACLGTSPKELPESSDFR